MRHTKVFGTAFLAATLTLPVFATEYLKGTLEKTGNGYVISHSEGLTPIIADETVLRSLPSLESPSYVTQSNGKKYAFEFKGEYEGNNFKLAQVPTNIAGTENLNGVLEFNLVQNAYTINGQEVKFGYTKVLNGYAFDDISKQSFLGTEVETEGHINEDGIYVINAIMPKGLFSAEISNSLPASIAEQLEAEQPWTFYLNTIFKNEISKSQNSFRHTVVNDAQNPAVPGDSFIVFTLGGRQGDSFGSVNGHFAAGLGTVNEDMSLRGEISNG